MSTSATKPSPYGVKERTATPKNLAHLAGQLYGRPLAISPAKLEELCGLFEDYRAGLRLRPADMHEAFPVAAYDDRYSDDGEELWGFQLTGPRGDVALIPLSGTITLRPSLFAKYSGGTSCEEFRLAFDQALADKRVRLIVIEIDSPGGEINGVDELSRHIFESRKQKPIFALANCLMASAAYYIGSAADTIFAAPTATVGSIGVVATHFEQSKREAEFGVKYTMIHAGKHKVDGNMHEPLSDQGRGTIQELVDDAYRMFLSAVARNRKVSMKHVVEKYGQGKIFLGQQAVAAGLANAVWTLDDVLKL